MRSYKNQSIAEKTISFIAEQPSIKECLKRGLINHTALAREVCRSKGISSIDAVVMASTRYATRIKKQSSRETELRKMVSAAKIIVRSKVILAAWERSKNLTALIALHNQIRKQNGDITIVEGHNLITVFTEEEFLPEIKETLGKELKVLLHNLVKITLLLPEKVTFTPGYAAYMFNLIASRGINMVGDVTSTAEHIFVIEEKDLAEALAALKV